MTHTLPQPTSYALRPMPPMRLVAVSWVIALIAVILGVVGMSRSIGVLSVLAIVLLVLALSMSLAVIWLTRRNTIKVDLDEQGFHVHGPSLDKRGAWADVTRVATTPDGRRLVIASGPVARTYIIAPMAQDPQMKTLADDIGRRLATRTLS